MVARVEVHTNRVWTERLLAIAVAISVGAIFVFMSPNPLGIFVLGIAIGLGVWLPPLARTRTSIAGVLGREDDALVVRGRWRVMRVPMDRLRGVRFAPGRRGASLVVQRDDGTLLAAALEDVEEGRSLAEEIHAGSPATDVVLVSTSRLDLAATILRPIASVLILGFCLNRSCDVAIPCEAEVAGIGALLAAFLVLLATLAPRQTKRIEAITSTTFPGLAQWRYSRRLSAHFRVHARAPATTAAMSTPRPRLAERGEKLAAWLARARHAMRGQDAYRGASMQEQLEHALLSAEVPLRERALALRVLSASQPEGVEKRIAELDALPPVDREWLESVALAEDDDEALAQASRRPPDFAE
jgi:hypothetical protein